MKQKTAFNSWSISYLRNIYSCNKCKKRNTILESNSTIQYQLCAYCRNPNYIPNKTK